MCRNCMMTIMPRWPRKVTSAAGTQPQIRHCGPCWPDHDCGAPAGAWCSCHGAGYCGGCCGGAWYCCGAGYCGACCCGAGYCCGAPGYGEALYCGPPYCGAGYCGSGYCGPGLGDCHGVPGGGG